MTALLLCASLLWTGDIPCERPEVQCACSECMTWNAVPAATRYEVTRFDTEWNYHLLVGVLEQPMLENLARYTRTTWCFAKDSELPVAGMTYIYRVRYCIKDWCSSWGNESMVYTAAPYMTW